MRQEILDLMGATQEQVNEIKEKMKPGEKIDLYMDKNTQVTLFKIKKTVYEAVYIYGDKPFTEVFKEMLAIAGDHIWQG